MGRGGLLSHMTKQLSDTTQIDLPSDLLIKAQGRARALGMTLSEYMQSLVDKDVVTKEHDPWLEPIPKEVNKAWEKDLAEFEKEDKKGLQPTFNTVEELIDDLDS